jgi:hypothetical protein
MSDRPDRPDAAPERITPEFRNGSLTAISVIVGFSLSFLSRWAGTPGKWHNADLFAVALIVTGSAAQIWSLGAMLFPSSMVMANYQRAIWIFLVGLALVAVGVAVALLGEILGTGQGILGG